MSTPTSNARNPDLDGSTGLSDQTPPPSYAPPTYASFSPANLSTTTAAAAKRRSTILVHQKSPLLLATPPQITRALAYSHPFLLPLNKAAGLVSWTTGDPWESFLLVAAFWAIVQYGNVVVRFAGPLVVVLGLIGGMYGRRFSPLSSSGWNEHPSNSNANIKGRAGGSSTDGSGGGHARAGNNETTGTRHQKTLDEIVETLKVLTTRCNILLEPLLELTDFLSTQRTATSATTRPALTTLFVRLLAITPVWVALTLPPLRIITTKRVVLVFGTLALTWHSRPCRVARTLLWRSATVRTIARWVTGLPFDDPKKNRAEAAANGKADGSKSMGEASQNTNSALAAAIRRSRMGKMDSGVRFTFILYENQRRWVGLGWTSSLFAYERAAWTDEQNNRLPPKDKFELPEVDDAPAKWRWVEGSQWKVDGAPSAGETDYDGDAGRMGWIFYDNKWQNGRRGQDGWGRWTRRRKWYRDAELVEKTEDDEKTDEKDEDSGTKASPTEKSGQPPPLPPRTAIQTPSHTRDKSEASGSTLSTSLPSDTEKDKLQAQGKTLDSDAASVKSATTTKSTSRFRFPTPTLRRRVTGGSTASQQKQAAEQQQHAKNNSETASLNAGSPVTNEEEEATLGSLPPALELEIQGRQRDQDAWGIGDEAAMGLD